jgi:lysozyme family protein
MLYRFEAYNGFGYRARRVVSPYLWSFSEHYSSGKYVDDGVYRASIISQQSGAGVLLKVVSQAGLIEAS